MKIFDWPTFRLIQQWLSYQHSIYVILSYHTRSQKSLILLTPQNLIQKKYHYPHLNKRIQKFYPNQCGTFLLNKISLYTNKTHSILHRVSKILSLRRYQISQDFKTNIIYFFLKKRHCVCVAHSPIICTTP